MPRTIAHSKKEKRTVQQKQRDFLEYFCELANITTAAKKAKIGRRTVYDWIETDPEFKKQYKKAKKVAIGVLEDEAARRAVVGVDKAIFYKGKKVATVKEYSDTLMIVLLKAQAPKKYREVTKVESKSTNKNINVNSEPLTPDKIKQISKALEDEY